MYLIELLGESLYIQMAKKEKETNLKNIFLRLAENEKVTGGRIQVALGSDVKRSSARIRRFIVGLASIVFQLVPLGILFRSLKIILRNRMYSQWFESYEHLNPILWQFLLSHENLQHELLTPYWGYQEDVWKKKKCSR
jgi:hypothetical protein